MPRYSIQNQADSHFHCMECTKSWEGNNARAYACQHFLKSGHRTKGVIEVEVVYAPKESSQQLDLLLNDIVHQTELVA